MSRSTIFKTEDRFRTGLGDVEVRVSLLSPNPSPLPTLRWLVELLQPNERVGAAVSGVTLAVEVHTSGGDHGGRGHLQPMPMSVGVVANGGGRMDGHVAQWQAHTLLSDAEIRTIGEMRDAEHGLNVSVSYSGLLIPLGPQRAKGKTGVAAVSFPIETFHRSKHARISNDDWRYLTGQLGWPRKRIFELADEAFDGIADFEGADKAFRSAQDLLLRGKRGEAIGKCRQIVEGVLRDAGYHPARRAPLWQEAKDAGLPNEVVELIKAFKNVASIEHHGENEAWRQADAQFLLMLALALAEYAGTLPKRVVAGG